MSRTWSRAARETNAVRLGKTFKPRGDIHPVAQDVFSVDDDVAEVDTHPILDTSLFGLTRFPVRHGLLDRDGTLNRINDTRKFRKEAVACCFDDPAVMLSDLGID